MLAVSGGHVVDVAVRFDGEVAEPLAAWAKSEYVSLTESFVGKI
jgi:hypothetical protein